MKVRVSINDIIAVKADAVIITSFEGGITRGSAARSVNKMLGGVISELQEYGEVKGKLNEINIIHSLGKMPARVIALAGLGKSAEMNLEKFRNVMGQACRQLAKLQCKRIAAIVYGTGIHGLSREEIAQAIVEGAFLGTYKFSKYLTQEHDNGEVEELILVEKDKVNLQSLELACARGRIMAEATNLARDMVNEPANYMTPSDMARVAKGIARKHKLGIKILESSEMQDLGMGALLGVAQGSLQPPKFIVMSYRGDARSSRSIAYIGKGITFDSGGISLKPSENMHEMKGDMSGGAAVIAALSAIS
ncbi:MAG TPA: M17 family peptidase N-terminal domain-containing protein, partial [Dehalococcoidia bacterium]|nr:M17 family peptidase N-terminal domain-containing protein [Dehalococcoidia bacterium]